MNAKQRRTFKREHRFAVGDIVTARNAPGLYVVVKCPPQDTHTFALIPFDQLAYAYAGGMLVRSGSQALTHVKDTSPRLPVSPSPRPSHRRLPDHQIALIHLGALDALREQLLKEQESLP